MYNPNSSRGVAAAGKCFRQQQQPQHQHQISDDTNASANGTTPPSRRTMLISSNNILDTRLKHTIPLPQFISPLDAKVHISRIGMGLNCGTHVIPIPSTTSTISSNATNTSNSTSSSITTCIWGNRNAAPAHEQRNQMLQQRRASPSLASISSLSVSEDSSTSTAAEFYAAAASDSTSTSNHEEYHQQSHAMHSQNPSCTHGINAAQEQLYRISHPLVSTTGNHNQECITTHCVSSAPLLPALLDSDHSSPQHPRSTTSHSTKIKIKPSLSMHDQALDAATGRNNFGFYSCWDNDSSNTCTHTQTHAHGDYSNHDHDTLSVAAGLCSLKRQGTTIATITPKYQHHTCALAPRTIPLKKRRVVGFGEQNIPSFLMEQFHTPNPSLATSISNEGQRVATSLQSHDHASNGNVSNIKHTHPHSIPIRPRTLALPSDDDNVNSLHTFVRSSLLEIIQVENDNEGMVNKHLFGGRVGLCCAYCKNVPKKEQMTHSKIFPKSLGGLYRSVCGFQRIHFKNCGFVPRHVKDRYEFLKSADKTRGKTKYWETSASAIGLVDVCEEGKAGIIFSSL